MQPSELADALRRERDAFFDVLAAAGESVVVGEWGARELIAHLGYWAGHATEAIHAVEQGRAGEHESGCDDADAVNETVARVARQTNLATVRRREEASVEALLGRLGALDPALLDTVLADGDTLEAAIREDGPDHYAEHATELRTLAGAQ